MKNLLVILPLALILFGACQHDEQRPEGVDDTFHAIVGPDGARIWFSDAYEMVYSDDCSALEPWASMGDFTELIARDARGWEYWCPT
jgi:hypothetical protein